MDGPADQTSTRGELSHQSYPKARVCLLWAVSPRFPRPTVVAAWSDGLVDAWHELYLEQREEAERFFRDFGEPSDGPWTFWTTYEDIAPSAPPPPVPEVADA